MKYWHGGRRGIAAGEHLKSPHERRREWLPHERKIEHLAAQMGYNNDRDPKRVYFTTDRELARGWAATHFEREDGGALYLVKPMPPSSLEPDPDYLGTGFCARRALVLDVPEDTVQMLSDDAQRAICLRYSLWSDLSPMYDFDGYMLPPPEHRAAGATAETYRHLGTWIADPGSVALLDGRAYATQVRLPGLHRKQ
jgi:hypothetical protein